MYNITWIDLAGNARFPVKPVRRWAHAEKLQDILAVKMLVEASLINVDVEVRDGKGKPV